MNIRIIILIILFYFKISFCDIIKDNISNCNKKYLMYSNSSFDQNDNTGYSKFSFNSFEFEISKDNEMICFKNEKENLLITIKILNIKEKCKFLEPLYFIPKNINSYCNYYHVCNTFNKHEDDCLKYKNETFEKIFPELKEMKNNLIFKNCFISDSGCFLANNIKWWYGKIFNENKYHNSYLEVYKCRNFHIEIDLEINIYHNENSYVNNFLISNEKREIFNITNDHYDINLKYKNYLKNNNFNNYCFLKSDDNSMSISYSCNEKDSLIYGEIGQIQCYNNIDVIELTNCAYNNEIFNYNIQEDEITCNVFNQDLDIIFNRNKLPKKIDDFEISYNENKIELTYDIFEINMILDGHIILENIKKETYCNIITADDDDNNDILVYNNLTGFINEDIYINFKIKSKSDANVHFICNNTDLIIKNINIKKGNNFKNYKTYFKAYQNNINEICYVYCNIHDKIPLEINGKFIENNIDRIYYTINKKNSYIGKEESFNFFHAILKYINTIWEKLNYYIFLIIFIILFLIISIKCYKNIYNLLYKLFYSCFKWLFNNNENKNKNDDVEMNKLIKNNINEDNHFINVFYNTDKSKILKNKNYKILFKYDGIYLNNQKIIKYIPKILLKQNYININYVNDNEIIVSINKSKICSLKIKENEINLINEKKYKIVNYILIRKEHDTYPSKTIALFSSNLDKNMKILLNEYYFNKNDLYYNNDLIIKNIKK